MLSSDAGKPQVPRMDPKDYYDKARLSLSQIVDLGVSGSVADEHMVTLLVARAITEGLLAVADSIYSHGGIVRNYTPIKEK